MGLQSRTGICVDIDRYIVSLTCSVADAEVIDLAIAFFICDNGEQGGGSAREVGKLKGLNAAQVNDTSCTTALVALTAT